MKDLGVAFETRTLTPDEFRIMLLKKVEEEASGVSEAKSREELISELADVLDVIAEIQRVDSISDEEIHAAQKRNTEKKGGFNDRVFLEWSLDDGYTTNEKKG